MQFENRLQTDNLSQQNDKYERQKQALEAKVKSLENELERARDRLKSLRTQAEERVWDSMLVQIHINFGMLNTHYKNCTEISKVNMC